MADLDTSPTEQQLEQLRRAVRLKRLKERQIDAGEIPLRRDPAVEAIAPADRTRPLPLSWAQQGLWFLDQLDAAAGAAYHVPIALRLQGRLDAAALQAALDRLVARHEILRTRFPRRGSVPEQEIADERIGLPLHVHELGAEGDHEAAVADIAAAEAARPFDLARDRLIRGQLIRISADDHVLLLTLHHIVTDGWSTGVLVGEVVQLYTAFSQGRPDPLPPLALQYADYAAWQRRQLQGDALQAQLDYWKTALADAPAQIELPTDRPRPALPTYAGGAIRFDLPAPLTASLRELARTHQCTLFMTLLAGWGLLLARLGGQSEIVIGSPVANRGRRDIESLIGFFVNSLALRVRVRGANDQALSTTQLLAQVKACTLGAYEHQTVPFEQVVEALQPVRSAGVSPIFQVMLSLNNMPNRGALELPGLTLSEIEAAHATTHGDLQLTFVDEGERLSARLEYASDLFDAASIMRWAGHLQVLLAGMAAQPDRRVDELPLLRDDERRQLLVDFNPGPHVYPEHELIHRMFEARAQARPDACALVFEGRTTSYGQLNRAANRIAHRLGALGVDVDDRVAICAPRNAALVAGILGILKAGGAYVPMDAAYPAERLAFMLADSTPAALLADHATQALLAPLAEAAGIPLLLLDDPALQSQPEDDPRPTTAQHARQLAYVMYTSGSTGTPKGVMIEHRSVLRLVLDTPYAAIASDDCVVHCANPAFDASTWEVWAALLNGARVLVVPQSVVTSPQAFGELLLEAGATAMFLTVALFNQYADALAPVWPRLRHFLFGGEQTDLRKIIEVGQRCAPQRYVHCYGPTETTTFATTHLICGLDAHTRMLPIGRGIASTPVYVLDGRGQPVPIGVVGEIHIGGAGVARGYLHRPELTAERFLPDPFADARAVPDARMYKTGDLARWGADGTIEYVGRNDFQVKIRGLRIELGEIEARLCRCPGVDDAVVLAREDQPGHKRLVAYVVAAAGAPADALAGTTLRPLLSVHLADYMLPSAFVVLDRLPLTPNGKIDRRALPKPDATLAAEPDREAPQGEVEQCIAALWEELLGVAGIGRDDDFFELGGHSLMVIHLIERLREAGLTADVRTVFSAPTPRQLAREIGVATPVAAQAVVPPNALAAGCARITPDLLPLVALSQAQIDAIVATVPGGAANVQDIYPLAPLQQGILFHHLLGETGDSYLLRTVLAFDSRVRLDAFLAALQRVVDRHDILRTAIAWDGLAAPVQVVLREARLTIHEAPTEANALERLLAATDPATHAIDLRTAPLLATRVQFDPASGEWLLALSNHHIVCDHITLELMIEEIRLILTDRAEALPDPLPYRDYIAGLDAAGTADHEAFFRAQLGDIEDCVAPYGIESLPADDTRLNERQVRLQPALAAGLRDVARRLCVTPSALFHAAYAAMVGRLAGTDEVVFGTVLSGRLQGSAGGRGTGRMLGLFINTLPLRLSLRDADAERLVRDAFEALTALLEHEQASLVVAQRCSGVAAPRPLFSALLNYRHTKASGETDAGIEADWPGMRMLAGGEQSTYPLTVSIDDLDDDFEVKVQAGAGMDPARIAGYLLAALEGLAQALRQPAESARSVDILAPAERERLLTAFNPAPTPFPADTTIHALFEAQAHARPDAIALVFEHRRMTYGELDRRANQVAQALAARGVEPGDRVTIAAPRGISLVAGILGILKAGAAYVPLDAGNPPERLAFLLADVAPAAMLVDASLRGDFEAFSAAHGTPLLSLDDAAFDAQSAQRPSTPPADPRGVACVLYTSGSTGTPKGVMIEHRGVLRLVIGNPCWPIAADDCVVHCSNPAFDAMTWELWSALLNGARVLIVARDVLTDPRAFRDLLVAGEASAMLLTTALFAQYAQPLSDVWPRMRHVLFGGEHMADLRPVRHVAHALTRGTLVNAYGPTEATTVAIAHCVGTLAPDASMLPIGKPIANTRIYILDARLQPAPVGVAGEIHIGGPGVARGYLNRPELSAERFLPDPFVADPDARMYKTGDLARWDDDGVVEYLGRTDFQVKIRGRRIEPGEIEARLRECAGVQDAVVLAREDVPGDKRLVAYVVGRRDAPEQALEAATLRAQLAARLADYMVPTAFVAIEAIPLTPNGKVDRRALPAPELATGHDREIEAPVGEIECAIAAIWQDLLGAPRVGREDHFFELGGHSLNAIQMLGRLRQQLEVEVPLRALFESPTLAALARVTASLRAPGVVEDDPAAALVPADRNGLLPLSWEQQRLWFLDQFDPAASRAYHIDFGLRLEGTLDARALRASLDAIVGRHEALRTRFVRADGEAIQVIGPADAGCELAQIDLGDVPAVRQDQVLEDALAEAVARPFELARGPLMRACLVRLAPAVHVLVVSQHHTVSDGWSIGVLVRELIALYEAFEAQRPDPLPALTLQYADYAAWQRRWLQGERLAQATQFWRTELAGAPALLELPTDFPRPPRQSFAGARVPVAIPAALARGVHELALAHDCTPFMVLVAAWGLLLARLSGQDDVVIGTPVANRQLPAFEPLIGFFVNTLALRVRLHDAPDVATLLARVRETTLGAQAHAALPFDRVVEAVAPRRDMRHGAIFQAMLALNNTPFDDAPDVRGLRLREQPLPRNSIPCDLLLSLAESGDTMAATLDYATDLFDASSVQRIGQCFVELLRSLLADHREGTALPVHRLAVLDDQQRRELDALAAGSDTDERPAPAPTLVHRRFEAQARLRPDAIALVTDDLRVGYADLNRRANRIAHGLLALGVRPDDRVALCVARGVDMVAAILGILKAGAGYVPLDPSAPAQRLSFMLDDCTPRALLTQSALCGALPASAAPQLLLDEDAGWLAASPDQDPELPALNGDHLAYVIYTSGSTGRPKGVMVEHANVARLFDATQRWFDFRASDVWTLFHSFAFDFSVWELWGALAHGGRLVIVSSDCARTPAQFWQLLCDEGVTVLNQTPSAFRQLQAAQAGAPSDGRTHALREIVFGGEALEPHTLAPWFANNEGRTTRLVNMYGITETTVHASFREITLGDVERRAASLIGVALPDLQLHVLDRHLQPVPLGCTGEIHVGGAGVSRGYLKRPELTAERFVDDPVRGRLYRTGDLARRRADGELEYLGRNDFQVKIRGFRIELGEIEARLAACAGVREAVVVAREDQPGDRRLVAYLVPADGGLPPASALREALLRDLADYMVPSAFVGLVRFPLTINGKLDVAALPLPDAASLAAQAWAAPEGETECAIAAIWQDLLGVERVGRHDNFFEIGGHSLMTIALIERLQERGLRADVRMVFSAPTPAALALQLDAAPAAATFTAPANLIAPGATEITPAMLPLVQLSQREIDLIVASTPGGAANVADIYPLSPLQDGILFHHLASTVGDAYLLRTVMCFDDRARLDDFLQALQTVIARHDVLRSAVRWDDLSRHVQVVLRHAPLPEHRHPTTPGEDALQSLLARTDPGRVRLDLRQAPLLAAHTALDAASGQWHLALLNHHLVSDNYTLQLVLAEIQALLAARADGVEAQLPEPEPYRNFIAQGLAADASAHEAWFRSQLADIDAPTAAFGLLAVQGDGQGLRDAKASLDAGTTRRVHELARRRAITPATLFHAAWGLVLGACSARDDVVFGTVLSGRLQGTTGAARALGPFINTLPLRLSLGGRSVERLVDECQAGLSELLRVEQASLAVVQRCSGVAPPTPLFTAILNYRRGGFVAANTLGGTDAAMIARAWHGIRVEPGEERTNYPLMLAVDDLGDTFQLTVQADGVAPERVLAYVRAALTQVLEALDEAPARPLASLALVSPEEVERLAVRCNETARRFESPCLIHQLFETQVARTPGAIALVCGDQVLSYAALNARANQLAWTLRAQGLQPGEHVALCLERGPALVAAMLAVLKAGGAYVPLEPSLPPARLAHMLDDSEPAVVLTQREFAAGLQRHFESRPAAAPRVLYVEDDLGEARTDNVPDTGLTPASLAYVIYTSGSTGKPKGVMIEHGALVNFLQSMAVEPGLQAGDTLLAVTTLSFDIAGLELHLPLMRGARIVMATRAQSADPAFLQATIAAQSVTALQATPATWRMLLNAGWTGAPGLKAMCGGEALPTELAARLRPLVGSLWNLYGPTETTVWSTCHRVEEADLTGGAAVTIGRPIANTRVYVLDAHGRLAPAGVPGELHIGGAGVARGYLNRPELTAERFVPEVLAADPGARMYRTGDLARWRDDGRLEYLGRNDFQVKVRGFRIETGEVEAALLACAGVRETAVTACRDGSGEQRLVGYLVAQPDHALELAGLREALAATLPDYMIPAALVVLPAMPLTPNGKLDRSALPAPEGASLLARAYEAPAGDMERLIAQVWCELLGVSRVGRDDHFFMLGGHSLMATQFAVRMRAQLGIDVPVVRIFQAPTLRALAPLIGMDSVARFDAEDIRRVEQEMDDMSAEQLQAWIEQQDALEQGNAA